MNSERIERILDSGFRASFAVAGGGSTALNALLTTPGASRFVDEARIPYSSKALERFLGRPVKKSCSIETAQKLAAVAFTNLEPRIPHPESRIPNPVSVSCTAALQTDRERRGNDRAFICIKTTDGEKLYALHFSKTSREQQEVLLSDWLLVLIAQAVGAERSLMLPGSFNPLHAGHTGLLSAAEQSTGLRGCFELSSANVDKPDLPGDEILRRASAIRDIPVVLTRAPRFMQKAELFPKTTFTLGYDTAARLVDPAYSDDWKNQWQRFQALETKFLVAGRFFQPSEKETADFSPRFQSLENLDLPAGFESLFEAIPAERFREDISSTELRGSRPE